MRRAIVILLASCVASAFEIPRTACHRVGSARVESAVPAVVLAGVLASSLVVQPALAADKLKGAGESVFSANCYACHAGGRNVILPDRTLQQDVSPRSPIHGSAAPRPRDGLSPSHRAIFRLDSPFTAGA